MQGEPPNPAGPALGTAHVAVIGVGGLGCPAALALARAGVGTLTLVDPDRVEASNLPRQLLHGDDDVGRAKVESAAESLLAVAPRLSLHLRCESFTGQNAGELLSGVDFAIDATDGIEAKLIINDAAVANSLPFCHAGILGLGGQVLTVIPGRTPCLRCLFPGVSDDAEVASCRQAGIVGPVAGLFGALQASLAIRHLRGDHRRAGVLVSYDRCSDRWRRLDLASAPRCDRCSREAQANAKGGSTTWAM